MIQKVTSVSELSSCLQVIQDSFSTVAKEMNLTKENCKSHTSFMKLEHLKADFLKGNVMYMYKIRGKCIAFFSLERADKIRLNHLAVLKEYRHQGIGEELVLFAKQVVEDDFHERELHIGIIEESVRLKKWYEKLGFYSTGTKQFDGMPFTIGFMELLW